MRRPQNVGPIGQKSPILARHSLWTAPILVDMVFHEVGSKSSYPLVTEKCMDTLGFFNFHYSNAVRNS